MYRILVFIFILVSLKSVAQSDSALFLNKDDFMLMVLNNHPIIKNANLLERKGKFELRKARGNFDPYLYNYFDEKNFNSKTYYSLLNGGLKIPTWYGIEGKVNFDNTSGYFLNPENSTPSEGLLSAGISISLGKGLFIDERRKTLQQAKTFYSLSKIEQFISVNQILFDALKVYWEWVIAYNDMEIYQNSVELAAIRFEGVKKSFYQGAEPAIDTLEAYIQLQNREYSLNETKLQLLKKQLDLSNYLWNETNEPLELSTNIKAPSILDEFHNYIKSETDIHNYLDYSINSHPVAISYDLKLKALNIEKRYKQENLKPKLNLNYNFLTRPIGNSYLNNFSTENYKIGIQFQMALFLRKERGDFKLSKIKIMETENLRNQKLRELENKIAYYIQEIKNFEIQEKILTKNTVNYETLLDAEKRKFEIGESSLFLINSRENKVIDSQIKLIEIRGKYQKSVASLVFISGKSIIEKSE